MYEKLHSALVAAMAQEKALLEQAKQLAKDAQVVTACRSTGTAMAVWTWLAAGLQLYCIGMAANMSSACQGHLE